jgi:hypothetical protein
MARISESQQVGAQPIVLYPSAILANEACRLRKCVICDEPVYRTGSRGPYPKYCGQKCITKSKRTDQRREYERLYRRAERASGRRAAYERAYNQRPEVKARYRQRYWDIYRDPFIDIPIPSPYTGHRWLEKIRNMVGPFDQAAPWADKYNDMIGEGVLAFLEGRDPAEAIAVMRKDYNWQEHRQVYLSAFNATDENDDSNWERYLPKPVVEPEPQRLEVAPRISWKKNKATRLHAAKRKGGRGPNRSHRKFRSKDYE